MNTLVTIGVLLIGFVFMMLNVSIGDLVSEELRSRLAALPYRVIQAAGRRMDPGIRDDLVDEWLAELDFVLRDTGGMPLTRAWRGLAYAAGVWRSAVAVGRERTGDSRSTVSSISLRLWRRMALVAATAGVFGAEFWVIDVVSSVRSSDSLRLALAASGFLVFSSVMEAGARKRLPAGMGSFAAAVLTAMVLWAIQGKPTGFWLLESLTILIGATFAANRVPPWLARRGLRGAALPAAAHVVTMAVVVALVSWAPENLITGIAFGLCFGIGTGCLIALGLHMFPERGDHDARGLSMGLDEGADAIWMTHADHA